MSGGIVRLWLNASKVSAAETELGFGVADGSYIDKDELSVQAEKRQCVHKFNKYAGCLSEHFQNDAPSRLLNEYVA